MKADMAHITKIYDPPAARESEMAARLRIANLDLLPVLHELLRTRSVTRTARSFNMTQPAISRALRHLRAVFNDQLLVSNGREGLLTERAQALMGPLRRALGDLDLMLTPAGPFDPATETVHIQISTADYVTQLLAPILTEICGREAPRVVLDFTLVAMRNVEDLTNVDFMIGPRAFGQTLGKRLASLPLWRDEMVCIASAANDAIPARLTPAQFQASRYVAFRRGPRISPDVHAQLQPTSPLEVAPVCTVHNFLVLDAVVGSNSIALVPR
jgi:DNA-binding transcriptional LysR family regulator